MLSGSDLPFDRPRTAREQAAAAERSKREAEMAELRRLRSEAMAKSKSTRLAPAEAAKMKREQELEEMRRMKAGENEEYRRQLSEKGGALTTDMDAWRSNQWGAKEADRKKKLEAQSGLHGHRGHEEKKTAAALDKEAVRKKTSLLNDQMAALVSNLGDNNDGSPEDGGQDCEDDDVRPRGVMFGDAPDGHIPVCRRSNGATMRVSFNSGPAGLAAAAASDNIPAAEGQRPAVAFAVSNAVPGLEKGRGPDVAFTGAPSTQDPGEGRHAAASLINVPASSAADSKYGVVKTVEVGGEVAPGPGEEQEKATQPPPAATSEQPIPPSEAEPQRKPAEPMQAHTYTLKAPTYTRVDIKFSFGLIVRSSAAEGMADGENLRDNETLRKCMEGTSKILREQMPSPPDDVADLHGISFPTFHSKFPEAYYNPTLEPTVISIEEDKKGEAEGKKTAKGNKRTLVKASFPVFLRDESIDDEGKKRTARMLKETKTTVFRALRAAVSGGSFLR